ncbi:heme peroxidase [Daedaleopsis nitida]|nr:heme peroxidase [Daedaleopsis nitida]
MLDGLKNILTLSDLRYLAARPVPIAPDGRYDTQVNPVSSTYNHDPHSDLYKLTQRVDASLHTTLRLLKEDFNLATFDALYNAVTSKHSLDDRKGLFTKTLSLLCRLPEGSKESKALNDSVIALLYNTLPHPPTTYIGTSFSTDPQPAQNVLNAGPRLSGNFRSADGSGNNVNMPNLGRAGTPYARSVQGKHPLPANVLPDPGDVFDSLLKARDFQPHPGRNSSLTFAYATLVTHQLFRTDRRDQTLNNTSSYLDLSVLYGNNQTEQDAVRDRVSGLGLLYPDAFSEDRLIFVPPAATALLVLFSRNHNYIADMLLRLNERGKWTNPPPEDPAARARQDEEIFQTARLVNCGNFMAMIFGDYVAGFLGMGRDGSSWSMNPFDPIKTSEGEVIGRGEGNQCSVEFNVLYRWHATAALKDIQWTEDIFNRAFKGKPLDQLTLADFGRGAMNAWKDVDPDPRKRTFAGLRRGPDGQFADDDLAGILLDATEKVAGAYRARGSPPALRIVEMMGMLQAREWGVCTMNEFRAWLGLKTFDSFEEWNPDPEIADAARKLYGHIDNLELYPGLQAEQTMPLGPASGICCGYTMTRAILGDAIALVRGDRFYTTDYTPANLTAWGFQDCARDPNNGAFGAAVPRLLFRHLPRHYSADNVYGLFPFFTPEVTQINLTKLGHVDSYKFTRPVVKPLEMVIESLQEVSAILNDNTTYKAVENEAFADNAGKFAALANGQLKSALAQSLFPNKDAIATHKAWIRSKANELITEHTYKLDGVAGQRLDIVGNVINLVPIFWVSEFLLGIPLKTTRRPDGVLTPQEVNDMLRLVFNAVHFGSQLENNWSISKRAEYFIRVLSHFIEKALPGHGLINALTSMLSHTPDPAHHVLAKFATSKAPRDEIVADILGLAVSSSVSLAKTVSQVVDFYLADERTTERAEVVRLAGTNDEADLHLLRGYVREAQRLTPQFASILREEVKDVSPSRGKQAYVLNLKKALVNEVLTVRSASQPADFPEPLNVNPRRPAAAYAVMHDACFYSLLGIGPAEDLVVELVKTVFQIPNLVRVPGNAGKIGHVQIMKWGIEHDEYVSNIGLPGHWPNSMLVTAPLCRVHIDLPVLYDLLSF